MAFCVVGELFAGRKNDRIYNKTKALQKHGGLRKGARCANDGMGRRSRAGFDAGGI